MFILFVYVCSAVNISKTGANFLPVLTAGNNWWVTDDESGEILSEMSEIHKMSYHLKSWSVNNLENKLGSCF